MRKDLVLAICGARHLYTSKSCGERRPRSMSISIGVDLDLSRYVSVRSRSWLG